MYSFILYVKYVPLNDEGALMSKNICDVDNADTHSKATNAKL